MTDSPPAGFQPFGVTDGFIGHNGPYYWRQDSAAQFEFGFQTDARHGNPNGVLHGGDAEAFAGDKLLVTATAIFRISWLRRVPGANRHARSACKKARRLTGLLDLV